MSAILDTTARQGKTSVERQAAAQKAERELDKRVAADLKRSPPDLKNTVPWSVVKKRNGL